MGAWIRSQIAGFMGGIVGSIKSFFGIRSPSALFAGIGGDLAEGIGVGFERAMLGVGEDMRKAIPTAFDLRSIDVGPTPSSQTSATASLSGPLVVVEQMVVRSETDIEVISRQLHRHIQSGIRARGGK